MRLTSPFLSPMVLFLLVVVPSAGRAEYIYGYGDYGKFEGSFTYAPIDSTHGTLTIVLTNVSPADNGGYLTAFAFNNPGNVITGATLTASDPDFELLGGPSFNNDINASPFGKFDLGAAVGSSFQGIGTPSRGIGVGEAATFAFDLTGSLDQLTEGSFFQAFAEGSDVHWFVTRFRGFNDEQSDRVPGDCSRDPDDPDGGISDSPEPGTLVLAGLGMAGFLGFGLRRRQ